LKVRHNFFVKNVYYARERIANREKKRAFLRA